MQIMLQPYHILLAAVIGWANERQQQIIEFQNDPIEALLEKLGGKRVLLTDDQRRLLAVKGHALGRKALLELTTIVTPDTLLRWHREHYHAERNHQGLENELIERGETTGSENGIIDCRERLGGLLKYYHRRAV